jgi:hypothetical protein
VLFGVILIIIDFSLIKKNDKLVAMITPVLFLPIRGCVAGVVVNMVYWEQIPQAL